MTTGPVSFILASPTDTTAQWADLDTAAIAAQLTATGVWAPAEQTPGLAEVVARADRDGHDMNIVVLDQAYAPFTVYRDIATELQSQVGGTVLVFGPSGLGTASDEFSRVALEDGASDIVTTSDHVAAANQLYDRTVDPHVDWTGVTIGLIVVVLIGAALARFAQLRRRKAAALSATESESATESASETPTGTDAEHRVTEL